MDELLDAFLQSNRERLDAYNEYANIMLASEKEYKINGASARYNQLIEDSNNAFESYEYVAGLRSPD